MEGINLQNLLSGITLRSAFRRPQWLDGPAERTLAYLHSGDVLRGLIPKMIRIATALWCVGFAFYWILTWFPTYSELERWGLVRGFVAQFLGLAAAFLFVKVTFLRAGQVEGLPIDDFSSLRALSVLLRWGGELVLYSLLAFVVQLLQWINALIQPLVSRAMPETASSSVLQSAFLFASGIAILTAFAGLLFLAFYGAATCIDLALAIEFNTRAERVGRKAA